MARLLRNLAVTRPNQVWAMDFTYIPMARGFIYLAAVIDWAPRRILAWRVSITLDAGFCIEALEQALARHSQPEIFNSDQGSQFTSTDFIKVLASRQIKISMPLMHWHANALPVQDGKGAWRDNVFIERLWRSIKYEEAYLRAYASVSEARAGIGHYIGFAVPIHRLTAGRLIKPTSTRCCSIWRRHNRGGKTLRKRPEPVQTNRATSDKAVWMPGTLPRLSAAGQPWS